MTTPFAETNVLQAALGYHGMGFSLIPCIGKRPAIKQWSAYQHRHPERLIVQEWFTPQSERVKLSPPFVGDQGKGHPSIGLVLGRISNNVVVIDLDGHDAVMAFYNLFPQAAQSTLTIATGSGKGRHLYYFVDTLPPNKNVRLKTGGGIEIRGNGQYVIAPPSLHPDTGKSYVARGLRPIAHVTDMDLLIEWLEFLRERNSDHDQARIVAHARPATVETDIWKRNYLETVVSEELARVTSASDGTRNNSLFLATLRLANYCAGGELRRYDMEAQLLTAAARVNIPATEAERTIASGFNIGWKYPKTVPPHRQAS